MEQTGVLPIPTQGDIGGFNSLPEFLKCKFEVVQSTSKREI